MGWLQVSAARTDCSWTERRRQLRKRESNEYSESLPLRHWGGYMLQALTPAASLE